MVKGSGSMSVFVGSWAQGFGLQVFGELMTEHYLRESSFLPLGFVPGVWAPKL